MPEKQVAVVTGANTGVGFAVTLELASRKFRVVMACRNLQKAEAAKQQLLTSVPEADLAVIRLDISEPDSIAEFVRQFAAQIGVLDLLINNAGIVGKTLQHNSVGQELQLATNYLGSFSLTGLLLPYFRQNVQTRIVNVGSLSHRIGKLALDDLNWEKTPYNGWKGYARSKIASMTYAVELHRRLQKTHSSIIALSAHPGFASTDIAHKSGALNDNNRLQAWVERTTARFIPQPAVAAQSILLAACSAAVKGGEYYGPGGFLEIRGAPAKAKINPVALRPENGAQLWELSEAMTGIRYLSDN